MIKSKTFIAAAACALACSAVQATEGGGSEYPRGVENYLAGAVPPPGFYWLAYGQSYTADRLNDNNGNALAIPGFKVDATAAVLRPVWSTPYQMLGGNLVLHTIVPFVDLKVSAAGASQHKTGVGDITVGVALARHHSAELHDVFALDLVLPTGGYTQGNLANIGRNYTTVAPVYAVTWTQPTGFNGDLKFTLPINQRNKDTNYTSGTELHVDFAAGWGMGNGWTLGLGGHVWRQLTDDKNNGATVSNNRVQAYGLGPSIKYDNGKGWFITAKWQAESGARNTTQGSAFWIKTVLPF